MSLPSKSDQTLSSVSPWKRSVVKLCGPFHDACNYFCIQTACDITHSEQNSSFHLAKCLPVCIVSFTWLLDIKWCSSHFFCQSTQWDFHYLMVLSTKKCALLSKKVWVIMRCNETQIYRPTKPLNWDHYNVVVFKCKT